MKKQLFCLPYSGSSAAFYTQWSSALNNVEIVPIELAGRGYRFNEKPYDSMAEAVRDIYEQIVPRTNGAYSIYGHSLGSLLAMLVTYEIQYENQQMPETVFCSGRDAPHCAIKTNYHSLAESDLLDVLIDLGGIDKNEARHKELMSIFVPIIRSDLALIENYDFQAYRGELDCNVVILNGTNDPLCTGEQGDWMRYSKHSIQAYRIEGNHFFLHERRDEVCQIIQTWMDHL